MKAIIIAVFAAMLALVGSAMAAGGSCAPEFVYLEVRPLNTEKFEETGEIELGEMLYIAQATDNILFVAGIPNSHRLLISFHDPYGWGVVYNRRDGFDGFFQEINCVVLPAADNPEWRTNNGRHRRARFEAQSFAVEGADREGADLAETVRRLMLFRR